jgi:uncharacterized protein (TIGR02001 family)
VNIKITNHTIFRKFLLRSFKMRKSLITIAVLGALAAPSFVFAAEKETKSDFTTSGSVGLFSQYIFRGLTQTDRDPAMQGNFDINHSSGLYLGMWGSNVSWPRDIYGAGQPETATYYKSGGNLELDIYGGFKSEIGKTGLGIDIGALQYYYPGTERGRDATFAKANTTEVYGALSYGWVQAKYSHVVSKDAWGWGKNPGGNDARGTYYAELNATVPIGELIGGGPLKGLSGIAHYGKQEFDGAAIEYASYEDYKLGLSNAFDNGVNLGAFWTDTKDAADSAWTFNGRNIGKKTGTVFLQKTF